MKKNLLLLAAGLVMSAAAADAATVYFENTGNWSEVHVWSWDGPDATNTGTWPGPVITETVTKDGHTYYKYETQCANIIFANPGGNPKTPDQVVVDNAIYNAGGITGESFTGEEIVIETTVYLAGSMTDWGASNSNYKFTKVSDTEYTLTLASMQAVDEFKVVLSSIWYSSSESGVGTLQNGTYDLMEGGMDNNMKFAQDVTNVTFTFNPETKALTVAYETGGDEPVIPVEPSEYTMYFEKPASWTEVHVWTWGAEDATNTGTWPGPEITETVTKDGKTYYKYTTMCPNIIFANKGGNEKTGDLNSINNMIYTVNGATGESFAGGEIEVETEVFLAGNFNSFSGNNAEYKFTNEGDGIYTFHLAEMAADAEFKVVVAGLVNTGWWGYVDSSLKSGETYSLFETATLNCKLEGAAKDVDFTYNLEDNTITVDYTLTTDPVVTVEVPENLYLVGNISKETQSAWDPSAEGTIALTKNGNVFTGKVTIVDSSEGYGYFSFLTAQGTWAEVEYLDRFGAATADQIVGVDTPVALTAYLENVNATGALSYKTLAAAYNVEVDFNNMTLTLTADATAVETIEVADEAPVYFDLQGNKVANPENGLYIKVVGNKAVKVLVK